MQIFLATLTGFICGIVFAFLDLPIPAPPVFAGIAGIIGIWLGFLVVAHFQGI